MGNATQNLQFLPRYPVFRLLRYACSLSLDLWDKFFRDLIDTAF